MPVRAFTVFASACLASLAGCASEPPEAAVALAPTPGASAPTASQAPSYQLSEKELRLKCKDLTGRMQVRILQIRDYNAGAQTTAASRALQYGSTSVLGGGKTGTNPAGEHIQDRAQLEAYNQRLAALNCKTFNLDDELRPKPVKATPTPTNAAPKPPAENP